MLLATGALRLLGLWTGGGGCLLLAMLLILKRRKSSPDWTLFALVLVAGMWFWGHAAAMIQATALNGGEMLIARRVDVIAIVFVPSLALHFALSVTNRWPNRRALAYALVPVMFWVPVAFGLALIPTAVVFASGRFWSLTAAFVLVSAATLAGSGSAALAWAAVTPLICVVWLVRRYHFLGLLVSRRLLFAGTLAVISACYLLAVRRIADYLDREYDAFGPLVEVLLIFAAVVGWIPLYEWMTRFLSRRTRLYSEFGRRVIDQAVPILDLRERVALLASGLGKVFEFKRVHLTAFGPPRAASTFGDPPPDPELIARIEGELQAATEPFLHLGRAGFAYAFALRYEDRLIGLLLVDCSPRVYLEEDEPVLEDLCRQITHSLEACRMLEEKIGLEKALLEQEQLATLGTLAATIAHEVKNPLGPMKTLAQLMAEDQELDPRYRRDLQYMLGEIDRLNRCVEQLLTFARPVPSTEARVRADELIRAVAGLLTREYESKRIAVNCSIDPGLEVRRVDRHSFQQILLNLTLNAVQASPPGSTVQLSAGATEDGRMRIAVTDDGPGVPPELRERVFEPFFTTKQQGTGLGLAIVRKNVRHLGGELRLDSPVVDGRGTTVAVTIPVTR